MKTITVQAAKGRTVVFPPKDLDLRLRGEMPAISKHGIEATPADPPYTIKFDEIADPARRECLRFFVRGRVCAGCLVETVPAAGPELAAAVAPKAKPAPKE